MLGEIEAESATGAVVTTSQMSALSHMGATNQIEDSTRTFTTPQFYEMSPSCQSQKRRHERETINLSDLKRSKSTTSTTLKPVSNADISSIPTLTSEPQIIKSESDEKHENQSPIPSLETELLDNAADSEIATYEVELANKAIRRRQAIATNHQDQVSVINDEIEFINHNIEIVKLNTRLRKSKGVENADDLGDLIARERAEMKLVECRMKRRELEQRRQIGQST